VDFNLDILKVLEEFQNNFSNFDRKINVGSGSASRDSAGLTTSTELAAFLFLFLENQSSNFKMK
jgi:hypothetical protein